MPFDGEGFGVVEAETVEALFRRRREAVAERWRGVPRENFDLRTFENVCGTTACALGWLAHWRHDGWGWDSEDPKERIEPVRGGVNCRSQGRAFRDAQTYFGLSEDDACRLFGNSYAYGMSPGRVTPAEVADRLLSLPYALPSG